MNEMEEHRSPLLAELDPYEAFVAELEAESGIDYTGNAQELMEYTEMIINALKMRLLVEPFCLLIDMNALKLVCGELICRLLRLKTRHYALSEENARNYRPKPEWSIAITIVMVQLENLYTFYNSHNIMASELGGM